MHVEMNFVMILLALSMGNLATLKNRVCFGLEFGGSVVIPRLVWFL